MSKELRALIALDNRKTITDAILADAGVDELLEVDLKLYDEYITREDAQFLAQELCYCLMYEAKDDKGRPYLEEDAQRILVTRYDWLLKKARRTYESPQTVLRHAEKRSDERWVEAFDSRTTVAASRFRKRMQEVDEIMPQILRKIKLGDIGAIDKFVSLARFDMDAAGYKAPTRYEFSASGDQEMTDQQKQEAAQALEHIRKFENDLLPEEVQDDDDIIEGYFVNEVKGESKGESKGEDENAPET